MDQRERWKQVMDLAIAVEAFDGPLNRVHWPLRELLQALRWYDFGFKAERMYLQTLKGPSKNKPR